MENKTYIVDRFENEFAVCEAEDLKFVNINKKELPENTKEGDILVFDGQKYSIDIEKTNARKKEIEDITKDLWL